MWQKSLVLVTGCSFVLLVVLQLPAAWNPVFFPPELPPGTTTTSSSSAATAEVTLTATTTPEPSPSIRSSCSENATARGPDQRVVSFNFYGDKNHSRRYFQGIAANAELVSQLYPGWVMRVYHAELEAEDPDVAALTRQHPHLDLCDVTSLPGRESLADRQPNTWRFLPLCDPLVAVFLSRDLDSRVSPRERAAVDEWLLSGLSVHVMRDHPQHKVPLLAGMWGARLDAGAAAAATLRALCPSLTLVAAGKKGVDQQVLWRALWPRVKGHVAQHDAYSCAKFNGSHGHAHAWPTRRPAQPLNFVGSRDGVDTKPIRHKCPTECRPPAHQDWTFC